MLCAVVVPLRRELRRLVVVRLHEALHDELRRLALLGDGRPLVGAAPSEARCSTAEAVSSPILADAIVFGITAFERIVEY